MAEGKQKQKGSSALARLTPNSITTEINGQEVIVAGNKDENNALNMIMISQGRSLIQSTLKKWKEMEEVPSPKEPKDIISAMKELAESSGQIYDKADPLGDQKPSEKAVEKTGTDLDAITFDSVTKAPEAKPE